MAWTTLCGSARMVTVRVRSSSVSEASVAKRRPQPSSQRARNSSRERAPGSNSLSRSRSGFSPSVVRKSVQRERKLPPRWQIRTARLFDSG